MRIPSRRMVVGGINGRVRVTRGDIGCLFRVLGFLIIMIIILSIISKCVS